MNFGVMMDELSKDFVIHGEEDTNKKEENHNDTRREDPIDKGTDANRIEALTQKRMTK